MASGTYIFFTASFLNPGLRALSAASLNINKYTYEKIMNVD
jgi:hypothetical protein